MKKIYTPIIFVFFVLHASAQKLDTSYSYSWQDNAWQQSSRDIYAYNDDCQADTIWSQSYDDISSAWVPSSRTSNKYVHTDKVSESKIAIWDADLQTYTETVTTTYTYDGQWRVTLFVTAACIDVFCTQTRGEYFYNANGDTDSTAITTSLNSVPSALQTSKYSYDAAQNPVQIITRTTGIVRPLPLVQRFTQTFNPAGKMLTQLVDTLGPSGYINYTYLTNTYDANNYLTADLTQNWNIVTSEWENASRSMYTNNATGDVTEEISQSFVGGDWENSSRTVNVYKECGILPVTLLSFAGNKANGQVNLQWKTANEINFSHFNIRRATDGVNFSTIGKVQVKGSGAGVTNYDFADKLVGVSAARALYQLQMVDKDGSSKLSRILNIALGSQGAISMSPNPVSNMLKIQGIGLSRVEIYSATGQLKYTSKISGQDNINMKGFGKGVYMVRLVDSNGSVESRRVVVQ